MGLFKTDEDLKKDYDFLPEIVVDILEDDDFYYIYADVPGKEAGQIKTKFENDKLSIRVLDDENADETKDVIIEERMHLEVKRLIAFEGPIDKKNVKARLDKGVLTITIKKKDPEEEDEENLIPITA